MHVCLCHSYVTMSNFKIRNYWKWISLSSVVMQGWADLSMYFLGLKFLLCWAESNCTRMLTLFSSFFFWGGGGVGGGIRCYYCHGFGFSIFFGGGRGDKMLLSWFWFQYFLFCSVGHTFYSIALFVWVGCRRGDLKVSCCGGGEGRKWDREMGVGGTQREVGWLVFV